MTLISWTYKTTKNTFTLCARHRVSTTPNSVFQNRAAQIPAYKNQVRMECVPRRVRMQRKIGHRLLPVLNAHTNNQNNK